MTHLPQLYSKTNCQTQLPKWSEKNRFLLISALKTLHSFDVPRPLCQFLNPYTIGRTPWTGDQLVTRPLSTHRTPQTE
jgi:hypothetical protein